MAHPLGLALFVILSAVAVIASLHAWRKHLAYGSYRFIAFETLAALVAWNAGRWFRDPLSIRQIISWTLIAVSTALAAHGVHLLRAVGRAQERIMEDTLIVVQTGVYRYIRHPLYASLALFGWGVFFKGTDTFSAILAAIVTAFLVVTARAEESFNIARLGSVYCDYRKDTKMFIPYVI